MTDMPVLATILRWRVVVLAVLAALLLGASWAGTPDSTDWAFFAWGNDTLFGYDGDFVRGTEMIPSTGTGGLHLYAEYPFLQIGPPALLLAGVLQIGPQDGAFVASFVVQALGLSSVLLLDRAAPAGRRKDLTVLVGGALVLVVWTGLAHSRHLDDALALTGVAWACLAVVQRHPLACGALLGLAAASKPWAVAAGPVLLALPSWRLKTKAAVAAVLVVALFWLPFVMADAGTLALGEVVLPFGIDSAPAALGARAIVESEHLRLLQFLGGMAVAAAAALVGRWPYAVLAAFAVRLLLEPFPYQYYTAALVVAALIADLLDRRRPWPLLTGSVVVAWAVVSVVTPATAAQVRLVSFGLLLAVAMGTSLHAVTSSRTPAAEPA